MKMPTTTLAFVCALMAVAIAPVFSDASGNNGRVLTAAAAALPDCPTNLPVTSTEVPGLDPTMVLGAKGTRNFTCYEDQPDEAYSEAYANVFDQGSISGKFFYDTFGFPTFDLDMGGGNFRKIVLFKEYFEEPSPKGADIYPWARFKVMSDTGSPAYAFVERRDTVDGGLPPKTCWDGKGAGFGEALMNFEANFNFYACAQGPPPPPAAIIPAPIASAPVVAPTPMDAVAPTPEALAPTTILAATPPTAATPSSGGMPASSPSPSTTPAKVPQAAPPSAATSAFTGAAAMMSAIVLAFIM